MPAAVYRSPGRVDVEERPVPRPGPGQVLLEVSHCGVCGSDLHFVLDGWGRPGSVGGHEYSGRVVGLGPDVHGWRVGEAAVGGPLPACGTCLPCRSGRPSLCLARDAPDAAPSGAFAGYTVVDHRRLVRPPPQLDLRVAALTEPLAVALHAISRSGIAPGQRALVLGAGPIGALVVAALTAGGVEDVRVSEPAPLRRELALRVGAGAAVSPDDLDVPTRGDPARIVGDAVDAAFDCSGKARAMEAGLAQLGRGGTLVLVGAGMEAPRLDPNRILLNELVVTGAYCYDADGFADALKLLGSGCLPVEALIEPGDVPLSGMLAAMEGLAAGRIAGKVLVAPRTRRDDARGGDHGRT
jgi:threonine dehydrogenase-like Zn-dependent dehydrogenase